MRIPMAMTAALLAASCGGGEMVEAVSGSLPATMPHSEAKFAASYGDVTFLLDATYVSMINQSVIVVRETLGQGTERKAVALEARRPLPNGAPFASSAYGEIAVDIAEQLVERMDICPGERMQLGRNLDGEARRMYRSQRKAWVVFAFCPAPEEG